VTGEKPSPPASYALPYRQKMEIRKWKLEKGEEKDPTLS
jgi:hypothetical protein